MASESFIDSAAELLYVSALHTLDDSSSVYIVSNISERYADDVRGLFPDDPDDTTSGVDPDFVLAPVGPQPADDDDAIIAAPSSMSIDDDDDSFGTGVWEEPNIRDDGDDVWGRIFGNDPHDEPTDGTVLDDDDGVDIQLVPPGTTSVVYGPQPAPPKELREPEVPQIHTGGYATDNRIGGGWGINDLTPDERASRDTKPRTPTAQEKKPPPTFDPADLPPLIINDYGKRMGHWDDK